MCLRSISFKQVLIAVLLKFRFVRSSPCYTFRKSRGPVPTSHVLHVSYFGFCLCYNSIQFALKPISYTRISFFLTLGQNAPPTRFVKMPLPKKIGFTIAIL